MAKPATMFRPLSRTRDFQSDDVWAHSSAVEHLTFNQRVVGSNPAGLTNKINNLEKITELARLFLDSFLCGVAMLRYVFSQFLRNLTKQHFVYEFNTQRFVDFRVRHHFNELAI